MLRPHQRKATGYHRIAYCAMLILCFLPLPGQAFPEPTRDTLYTGKDTGAVSLQEWQNRYAAWDTNRADAQTAQLYAGLSRAYAEAGDTPHAYAYFERYSKVKDALFYQAKNREIQKLKLDVAAVSKDRELAERNAQLMHNQALVSRKNAIMLGLAGGILLILILCLQSVKSYMDKRNLLKRVREQMDQDTAISMLHASMQGEHQERSKIAVQLHHTIRPLLQEVQQQLKGIEDKQPQLPRSAALGEAQQIVQDVQQELDDIATALASSGIGTQGLVSAVRRFIRNIPKDNALTVHFTVTGQEAPLAAEKEMILYRILQELVQNIMKHAHAGEAGIFMTYSTYELHIRVHDNGTGFQAGRFDEGMGWANVRDRVLYLRGDCTRHNEDGTTILIRVPV